MGRKSVRTAVAAYFSNSVTGLNQVTRTKKRNTAGHAFFTPWNAGPTTKMGAVGWVYLEGEHEQRIATPVVTGKKQVTYGIGLRVEFRSVLNDTEAAIDAFDDLIEAIKAKLRADPTLNGQVFVAGEGDLQGAPDIAVDSDEPKDTGDLVTVHALVRFVAIEMITA